MKKTLSMLAMLCTLAAAAPVSAGGYGHGYRHGGYFHGFGHGHGYRHHGYGGNHAQYFVGGLLLGTLLAPPRYVVTPPPVVYAPQPAPVVVTAPPSPPRLATGRRLLRDINGNCFDVQTDAGGREIRLPLAPSECAW